MKSPVIGYRISGSEVLNILKKLTKKDFSNKHSRVQIVKLFDSAGSILDECSVVYFKSPSDIQLLEEIKDKKIRVGGMVKEKSVQMLDDLYVSFTVTDFENEISVTYKGVLPNLFKENSGVVASGYLNKDEFVASEILAKHDENYMPQSAIDKLKEEGKWRGN